MVSVSISEGRSNIPRGIWLLIAFFVLACFAGCYVPEANAIYSYGISGPYYDDGTIPTDDVTVTAYYMNSTIYTFTLTSNGTAAGNTSILSSNSITKLVWNASSINNYTRVYELTASAYPYGLKIYIPNPSVYAFPYSFTVTDFFGMSNPYLSTSVSSDGTSWSVVEKKKLESNPTNFILTQYLTYRLTFTCDEGTYIQTFTAQDVYTIDLLIAEGAFPTSTEYFIEANATRTTSTSITTLFYDPSSTTGLVSLSITHQVAFVEYTDYSTSVDLTGLTASLSVLWASANDTTDYMVHLSAVVGGSIYEWDLPVPYDTRGTNPFDGLIAPLGTFPLGLNADELPWVLVVILVAAIFSYWSITAGVSLAWIIAGVFLALGWLTIPLPIYGLGGVVCFLVGYAESKKTEREL